MGSWLLQSPYRGLLGAEPPLVGQTSGNYSFACDSSSPARPESQRSPSKQFDCPLLMGWIPASSASCLDSGAAEPAGTACPWTEPGWKPESWVLVSWKTWASTSLSAERGRQATPASLLKLLGAKSPPWEAQLWKHSPTSEVEQPKGRGKGLD